MSNLIYSETIANAINDYLKSNGWHFGFDSKLGLFNFNWVIRQSKIRKLKYTIDVSREGFAAYVRPEFTADEDNAELMVRLSECINRINFGLRMGNFELDYRDGELRYKYSVDCPNGSPPHPELIERSIHIPAAMYRRYSPALMGVLFADANPKKAVAECEDDEEMMSELTKLLEEDGDSPVDTLISRLESRLAELRHADGDDSTEPDGDEVPDDDGDEVLFDLFSEDDD